MNISRRVWLATMAAGLPASRALAATFNKPVGVQLYTLRRELPKAAEASLKGLAEIGFKEVEILQADLPRLMPMLKDYGLKATSCHYAGPMVTGNWKAWAGTEALHAKYSDETAAWKSAVEEAVKYGIEYMVLPYVQNTERGDAASYEVMADKMNRAGEACKAAGRTFAYHNHAFEWGNEKGFRPIDILLKKTDPKLVFWELDLFWVSVAGQNPVQMLKDWKGRVPLVHLKDKPQGLGPFYSEGQVKPADFREVGSGSLDWSAVLKQAAASGVKHYFVEQDQTPGDPLASLRKSYEYLRTVKV